MVRIEGDEAFILAVIEVVKVILIGICVSSISVVDHIWCAHVLRRYGEVTMYDNNISRVIDSAFGTFLKSLAAFGYNRNATSQTKRLHRNSLLSWISRSTQKKRLLSIRTFFLIFGVLLSVVDIISLFALSTEGKNVADKLEFGLRMEMASNVPPGVSMEWYNPHECQIRYEYVYKRLGKIVQFKDDGQLNIKIPRKLDVNKDEKWPFIVPVPEQDTYATIKSKDFTVREQANFSTSVSQVTGVTESGIVLRHYQMARRDYTRKACAGSMSGVKLSNSSEMVDFCYTDELRNKSCANSRDGESVTFAMKCSRIEVKRFGGNIVPGNRTMWWFSELASTKVKGTGGKCLMQMNSLRAYREDPVSPAAMVTAALLTEFPSQILLSERLFAVDVSVVIIPDWLVISAAVTVSATLSLSISAAIYAAIRNLVIFNDWRELMIANLLASGDSLNRDNWKEFRCVVGNSNDWGDREFRLFVEPDESVIPVSGVRREDIG